MMQKILVLIAVSCVGTTGAFIHLSQDIEIIEQEPISYILIPQSQLMSIYQPREISTNAYLRSVLPGALLGILTGSISGCYVSYESDWIWRLLVWAIESNVRNKVVNYLTAHYTQNNLRYDKELMENTAWLASWASYLLGT